MNEWMMNERMNDEWMNEWLDEWMNGWMDEWMNEWWMNGWMNERMMNEWMKEWLDEWMNGWMNDEWMDEWMNDEWMNGEWRNEWRKINGNENGQILISSPDALCYQTELMEIIVTTCSATICFKCQDLSDVTTWAVKAVHHSHRSSRIISVITSSHLRDHLGHKSSNVDHPWRRP